MEIVRGTVCLEIERGTLCLVLQSNGTAQKQTIYLAFQIHDEAKYSISSAYFREATSILLIATAGGSGETETYTNVFPE